MARKCYTTAEIDMIRDLVSQGKVAWDIGERLGRTEKAIRKTCARYGIASTYIVNGEKNPRYCGSASPLWKGGSTIDRNGYRLMLCRSHPFANSSGYVREHRLVMEEVLGRYLTPLEVVHHIDGNKLNNAPENLELFANNSEHLRVELSGKCPKWTPSGVLAIQAGVDKIRKPGPGREKHREACRKYQAKKRALRADALRKQRSSSRS